MEGATVSVKTQITKLPKIDPGPQTVSVGSHPLQRPPPPYTGLSGPSYSISGLPEKFRLPPARVLQPGVDHQSGQLDSWPVHPLNPAPSTLSLGQSTASKLERAGTLPHSSSPSRKLPPERIAIVPKPKFLEQLESYLHKELRLLGCPPYGPHELRLQAHREVFEYLIEDFKTYKPLLSAIKSEYDLFITQQQEIIRELEPMRAQLETVREECERKIMALREEERSEEAGVQRENERLVGVIGKMRVQELSYKAQVEKLQEEVAELYEKYRHEADARKLLISDYNDLKYRQQEQKSEEGGQEEREDPVVLKLKLVRTREDLRAAHQRINTMLADYGDVVPRREFEMLETSYKSLESEVETLKGDHATLVEEHSTLQELYKEVLSQRDRLASEVATLKRSATPRPDWSRCETYIDGGTERWSELSQGRSSDQLVDVLLAQIAGVDVSEIAKEDAFQGQGLDERVPRYLRVDGPVRNRHIGRKEVNELINGFWQHRLTSLDTSQPIEDSLYSYLLSRNEDDEARAVEDGYNLGEASSRFAHEPHITLFAQILSGEVEEGVFHKWMQTQTSLTEAFSQQQQAEVLISENALEQVLTAHLPAKPAGSVRDLLSCAAQQQQQPTKPGMVDFIKLMSPDMDGQPSPFVLLLLEQSRQETKQFVQELAEALGNQTDVTLGKVSGVVQSMDPSKPPTELHFLLSQGFAVPVEQVSEAQDVTVPLTKLLERLQRKGAMRSGPRPAS